MKPSTRTLRQVPETGPLSPGLAWLAEGGEMGRLISEFAWEDTPLGTLDRWPQSLRTSVSLMLSSQHPMWIGWGPAVTFLYNDAYVSVLSRAKHPWALGRPAAEVWAEIWDICGPLADKVFHQAQASFLDDVQLFMKRGDFTEETYYSFSYSPIRDESGKVGGLFCPSADVSAKVLNARRLATLSQLAANSLVEKTVEGACASAMSTLARNDRDIPFGILYLLEEEGAGARRAGIAGLRAGDDAAAPSRLVPAACEPPWLAPVGDAFQSGQMTVIAVPALAGLPLGPAEQRVSEAVALPLISRGNDRPLGVLIAGVNPARRFDPEYRTFFELLAAQLATAIRNAKNSEEDRQRAEKLAELDRAKTTFFSNVSHELRTPLTLMLGPLEDIAARNGTRDLAAVRNLAEVAQRNGLRLLKLVNTLLDFSRIEAGRVNPRFAPTDASAFTAELASTFRSAMEKAGLAYVVDCPPLPEPAYLDKSLWEKIVLNLISNAFKFTLAGEVRVSIRGEKERFLLTVQDTGVGIPADIQPRVFERFFRVEGTRGRTQEGTGIGLALVRELVELHGGTVRVESRIGAGTAFTVEMPLGFRHLPVDRVLPEAPPDSGESDLRPYVEEALGWTLRDASLAEAAVRPAAPPRPGGPPARVLLVDDNADMRNYVRRLLAQRYTVLTAGDGEEAVDILRRERPDLILSDVMMPRLDGFGLIRAVRQNPAWQTLPIILLSARAGEEARVEGVERGADDYLVKPFSSRELLARVDAHLELARLRREAENVLRESRARLEQHAQELERTVAERTSKLQETVGELEAFSYSISHDMRAPLRSMQGYADLVLADYGARIDPTAEGYLRRISKNAARLELLVRDVLAYSKVAKQDIALAPVNLESFVPSLVAQLPELQRPDVRLVLKGPFPVVLAHEAYLSQIFSNLVSNAVKFASPGVQPLVEITASRQDPMARLSVRDNGIGIDPAHFSRIFEIFGRIHPDKKFEGTGIGLSIVKKAVQRMGGTVGVDSKLCKGSDFWFTLRLA